MTVIQNLGRSKKITEFVSDEVEVTLSSKCVYDQPTVKEWWTNFAEEF